MQNYFLTPIGYVFTGVFVLVGGFFFFLYNIAIASADMTAMFGNLVSLFMLLVSFLSFFFSFISLACLWENGINNAFSSL